MIALWIILGIVALIAFLLTLNIHITFSFNKEPVVTLRILIFRFNGKKLATRLSTGKKNKPEKEKTEKKTVGKKRKKGSASDFVDFISLISGIARQASSGLLGKMRIRLHELYVSFALEDASATAILYGAAIQAANQLFCLLERFTRFSYQRDKLYIAPDFSTQNTGFRIRVEFIIKPIYLLRIVFHAYSTFLDGKDKRK